MKEHNRIYGSFQRLVRFSFHMGVVITVFGVGIGVAIADEQKGSTGAVAVLEEIIVTAQKREENLQDVPISITSLSGEKIDDASIFKIEDLQDFIPNFSQIESAISTQIYIRGIGSGNNQAFEQSVGQYVDGIYFGRQQLLRMPFLDIERVEVLRGPQSTLFGKNTISGALNITTAQPTDIFEGRVSVNYSPDSDVREYRAVISGPLSDSLSGRLAVRKYDEDGYIDNALGPDGTGRDEFSIRGSLKWSPNDDLEITLKTEFNQFDSNGRAMEIVQDDPALPGAALAGLTYSQILAVLGYPEAITDAVQDNKRQSDTAEYSYNDQQNHTLTIHYSLGKNTLTAISAYVGYKTEEGMDADFTGAPILDYYQDEEFDQFSQEVRLESPIGNKVDWLGGLFYQYNKITFDDLIDIFEGSLLGKLAGGALLPIVGTGIDRDYSMDSDLWAAFGQATWNITDSVSLTAGARYTKEKKKAMREINIIDTNTGDIATNPIAPILYSALFRVDSEQRNGHLLNGERNENSFTPTLNVKWDVTNEMMLYTTWSKGFKAGGFDARANSGTGDWWEFEDEKATAYELGTKTTWLDGAAELNIALYRTEYDDLQVSQFDGSLGYVVGNAKKTTVKGVEIDGRWALTENMILNYGLAYLDHEYNDFTNGNCYNRQVPDGDVVGGVGLCDYTGKSGQYTPEITSTVSLSHVKALNHGLKLRSGIDVNYVDEQNTHVNLDPQYLVDSITKINLRLGLYGSNWDVAVLAQNITDKQQLTYVGNPPLSGSTFGTNTFYAFVSRPRTVYLKATYHF